MSDTKPLETKDWLDEQEFYEVCKSYWHAKDAVADFPGMPTAGEAFEALKKYVRERIELEKILTSA